MQACDNKITGRLREQQKALVQTVDRASKEGKTFVSVVTTCAVILQELPGTPKGERGTVIQQHLDTVVKTGAELPDNLVQFLKQEQQKAIKPAKSSKKKQASA